MNNFRKLTNTYRAGLEPNHLRLIKKWKASWAAEMFLEESNF